MVWYDGRFTLAFFLMHFGFDLVLLYCFATTAQSHTHPHHVHPAPGTRPAIRMAIRMGKELNVNCPIAAVAPSSR